MSLPNDAIPMVAMPVRGSSGVDGAGGSARSAVATSLAKLTAAHGKTAGSRWGSMCSQETIEEAKSVAGCVAFTLVLLSVLTGHAAASLGALAAARHARPAPAGNTTDEPLRLGPGCTAPVTVPSGAGPALGGVARHTQLLSELQETASKVGYGRLGKGSMLGFEGIKARVEGTAYHHVVSMHPPSGWSAGGAFATFPLPRVPADAVGGRSVGTDAGGEVVDLSRWCGLVGAVAINDGNNLIGRSGSPLTFSVRDGVTDALLWASEPIQSTKHVQDVRLALPIGVRALKLQVGAWSLPTITSCCAACCSSHKTTTRLSSADVGLTLAVFFGLTLMFHLGVSSKVEAANSNACAHAVWVDPTLIS